MTQIYSSTVVGPNVSTAAGIINLSSRTAVGVQITGAYAQVSSTITGLALSASYSFDGVTYTDADVIATTTPTSGTASTKMVTVPAPAGAQQVVLTLKNLDDTFEATAVAVNYAEAL